MRTTRTALLAAALLGLLAGCDSSDPVTLKGDKIILFPDYITADTTTGQFSVIVKAIVMDPDSGVRRDGVLVFFRFTQLTAAAKVAPTEIITNDDGEAFTFIEADGDVTLSAESGSVTQEIQLKATGATIPGSNEPPVADLQVTTLLPIHGVAVTFDVSASTDPEDRLDTWQITSFGDGTAASQEYQWSTTKTTNHTYTSAGNYTATVKVTDEAGMTDTATKTVNVQ